MLVDNRFVAESFVMYSVLLWVGDAASKGSALVVACFAEVVSALAIVLSKVEGSLFHNN